MFKVNCRTAKTTDGQIQRVSVNNFIPAESLRSICLVVSIFICFACGCEPGSEKQGKQEQENGQLESTGQASFRQEGQSKSEAKSSAKSILNAVVKRYQAAKSYQDSGVLYLSYRLNGQRLDEPKRWSTSYHRDGKLSIETFNAKIRADGDVLACEIFDIETGNLDNQKLVVPYDENFTGRRQPPLQQVVKDKLARHFVLGFSELPLDPRYETLGPWLMPAPASLLTGQVVNRWLQTPAQAARLADQEVDGQVCYVVRSQAENLTADIWINQQTLAIVQISLPLKLLADEVITSDEVSEVVFVAKFHDAVFDAEVASEKFEYAKRNEAVFVRKLVSLPEPLACEKIGMMAPEFSLVTPDGGRRGRDAFAGSTSVLVWLSGVNSIRTASQLQPIVADAPEGVIFGIVYSDSDTDQPGSGRPTPSEAIRDLGKKLNIETYFDRQHSGSSRLKINSVPAALVMDADGKVQYVQTMAGQGWQEKLAAAIDRVNAGDDVADEMREAYAQYLDTYHQQILSVSADSIVGNNATRQPNGSGKQDARSGQLSIAPKRIWTNTEFRQAGNVVALEDADAARARFAIYDGVQSIGIVDGTGRLLKTVRPGSLAKDDAITTFRLARQNGPPKIIAFSVMGTKYVVLDGSAENLTSSQTVAEPKSVRRIADIQWIERTNQAAEFLVAWQAGGVQKFSAAAGGNVSELSGEDFNSLAVVEGLAVGVSGGKLLEVGSGRPLLNSELKLTRIVGGGDQFVGIGQNIHGKWTAIGLDRSFERLWALETGPQLHENFLSPISSSTTSQGQRIWAIADSEKLIQLIAGSGQWLGEFQAENEIEGLCVANIGGEMRLLICSKLGVECWNLNVR